MNLRQAASQRLNAASIDLACSRHPDARMKRWYNDEVPEAAPKRSGPGPFAMGFALMVGAMIALTSDSHIDTQYAFVEVKQSISKTLQALNFSGRGPAPLRTGEWPKRLFTFAQTPGLSTDGAPAIAIVIDDLGGNVTRT